MVLLCIWLLLTSSLRAAEPAQPRFDFNLPAAQLAPALELFSVQCGASAGMAGALPAVRTRAVVGRFTAHEALQRMLAGSGYEAVPVGPLSFRLQPVAAATAADGITPAFELAEVLVTANKRSQALPDLPLAVTVVDAGQLASGAPLGDTRAALDFDAATSSTNLGPGRNRHFIRGVADSAFLGPSQATVSIQFDETRLNFNAPDPGLRLIDVERVEVLKGPQGPLYGTGALGGVVHIVLRHPDLDTPMLRAAVLAGTTAHGGTSPGMSAVVNLPLVPDAMALRASVYAQREAGWIDNAGARANANDTRLAGGRAGLRVQLAGDWLLDLQGVLQDERVRDSQYVPGGEPSLVRSGVLPEPRDNDLYLAASVLRGRLLGGELVFSSSYLHHEANGLQDASAAAAAFGVTAPLRYADERAYRLLSNELRYSRALGARLTWLAGLAQLRADSHIIGRLDPMPAAGTRVTDLRQRTDDVAAFSEVGVVLAAGLRLTAGLRLARAADGDPRRTPDTGEEEESDDETRGASVVHTATPSLSLDWRSADRRRIAYLRYARADRPGGLNPDDDEEERRRFRADELSSLEAGVRVAGDAISLQAAAFATRWRHVQSDYLRGNGLIGTRNVGNAGNLGIEAQLRRSFTGWYMELGTALQRARLDDPSTAAVGADARLPVVPDARAYGLVVKEFAVSGWQARLQLRGDYAGAARLSFDAGLDRQMPAAFALGAGATLTRGQWELQLTGSNLLDSRADTFAFGNPFSIRDGPQRTPRRPRTLTLQLARDW